MQLPKGRKQPFQNQCLTSNLKYRADVENNANKGTKIYFNLAETSFKEWLRNYNKDFNSEQYRKTTELSKDIWSLKNEQIMPRIRWSLVEKVYVKAEQERIQLITTGFEPTATLFINEHSAIGGCRHKTLNYLKNVHVYCQNKNIKTTFVTKRYFAACVAFQSSIKIEIYHKFS